jgi:proteasome accessory factor C
MDKVDHIYKLHELLRDRRTPLPLASITEQLACSAATVYRLVKTMREQLGAPIVTDRENGGYYYERTANGGTFELPGLWFNAAELQALAVFEHLFESLQPGFLAEELRALSSKINKLAEDKRLGMSEAAKRIRILGMGARPAGPWFHVAASATLQRKKLHMRFHNRARDDETERTVSPQRIVHYRDNWYLDAWCELRKGLRSFSISEIRHGEITGVRTDDIDEATLNEHYATSYGIFAGKANKRAVLRFSSERTRWVKHERWHPDQVGHHTIDGGYELSLPYRDERELVMDILRHGPHVEVISPSSLRTEVARQLSEARSRYGTDT